MQKFILSLILLVASVATMLAQNQDKPSAKPTENVSVKGNVRDALNHAFLANTYVEVLSPQDSTVLAADSCTDYSLMYAEEIRGAFRDDNTPVDYIVYAFNIPAGDYLLRFTRKGYETLVMPLNIPRKQHGFATKEWHANDAMLQRVIERQLGEATVTATQIMMVHRGDTVVFNADYFQLAQGNMLDRLVSMLPGLEIKSGGQIFYQGNRLSNLLVNGKDFFTGDPAIALHNLPAYMVKNIKIYRRGKKDAALDAHKDLTDTGKPNTLDVTLKREYNRGWMGNMEVGTSPYPSKGGENFSLSASNSDSKAPLLWRGRERYLGRLFALYFSDHTQFGIIANCNNVSNSDDAGSDGAWKAAEEAVNGIMQRAYGGLTFSHEWPKRDMEYKMHVKATHDRTTTETATSSTSFFAGQSVTLRDAERLQTGDVFGRRMDNSTARSSSLNFHNSWEWKAKRLWMYSPLDIEVGRSTLDDRLLSAALTPLDPPEREEEITTTMKELFDSLLTASPRSGELWGVTNWLDQSTTRTDQRLKLKYRLGTSFKSPLTGNKLSLDGTVHHTHLTGESTEDFRLHYPQTGTDDVRNRLFKTSSNDTHVEATAYYSFNNMMSHRLAEHFAAYLYYKLNYDNQPDSRRTYLLPEWRGGDTASSENSLIGIVTSPLPLGEGQGEGLSYDRTSNLLKQHFSATASFKTTKTWSHFIHGGPAIEIQRTHAEDTRSTQQVNRRDVFFAPFLHYQLIRHHDGNRGFFDFFYDVNTSPVSSYYLLDIHDATNPLSQMQGNADLRYPTTHSLKATYDQQLPKNRWIIINAAYKRIHDALAMGYTYNPTTGAYTYRPENVQGNWSTSVGIRTWLHLDSDHRGQLYLTTNWNLLHSVDVVNSQLSVVNNNGLSENVKFSYRFGTFGTAALHADVRWQTAHSAREGFIPRSSVDLNYGPDLNFKLPHDLQFSTDFSVLQRTGYDDSSMNDFNLIWNAALTWDFDFRRSSYYRLEWEEGFSHRVAGTQARPWSLRITAHDLLHQLSNTRRVVNAQGITETWVNSVPAYVMVHILYRWNKLPKKK